MTFMTQVHLPDETYLQNFESFSEYLRSLKKFGNEQKIKLAEKIFLETYRECLEQEVSFQYALQKAIRVTFCFLVESEQ